MLRLRLGRTACDLPALPKPGMVRETPPRSAEATATAVPAHGRGLVAAGGDGAGRQLPDAEHLVAGAGRGRPACHALDTRRHVRVPRHRASPWYDGTSFARDGVVFVSINYRIGAEGFLFLNDGTSNLGLLDQIAALEWVQQNIAAFGGDPGNVTIFVESAGGLSVGTLLSMPHAKGLFRRAIIESGGGHHVSTPRTAERIGRRLAELLGTDSRREAIASVPIAQMLKAQEALRGELLSNPDPAFWGEIMLDGLPWEPVIDGDLIPVRPIEAISAGIGADVDILSGSNTEEWRLFLVPGGAGHAVEIPFVFDTLGAQTEPLLGAQPPQRLADVMHKAWTSFLPPTGMQAGLSSTRRDGPRCTSM